MNIQRRVNILKLYTTHKYCAYISFSSSLHLIFVLRFQDYSISIFLWLVLLARAVVADEAHEGEEVVAAARVLLHLLVDPLRDVRG